MRVSLAVLAALAFVLAQPIVLAEELCAPEYDGVRRRSMDIDGQAGIWMAAPVARCVLARLEEYPLLQRRILLLEERLGIADGQIERLRYVIELSSQAEQRGLEALARAETSRQQAEDRLLSWHRSPAFWTMVGVLVAGALVAVTAWGLSAVSV